VGTLPFGREQFLDVIAAYNAGVAPLQLLLLAVAAAALALPLVHAPHAGRWVAAALSLLWLWMGVVFHVAFFSRANPAAFLFGGLFIVQAGLFAALAASRGMPAPDWHGVRGMAAAVLLVYGLVAYPALADALGHEYPRLPTFGLPCPTTIFTLALLTLGEHRPPGRLFVVPALWSVLGVSAALQLGMWEDLGLAAAGVLAVMAARSMPVAPAAAIRAAG
jgi:hypothetical protein